MYYHDYYSEYESMGLETRRYSQVKKPKKHKDNSMTILGGIISMLCFIIILVLLSVFTASIQYENNNLEEQNSYLKAEIDVLNSQIVEQTKISKIEEIAVNEYNMVYPTSSNCTTIKDEPIKDKNLASAIINEAYK